MGAGAASVSLLALTRCGGGWNSRLLPDLMGPLSPVRDESSGLPMLELPEGFRYHTFSWAGSSLHDGRKVPIRADGMGVVRQKGSLVTMVRNHEVRSSSGAMGDPADSYDVTGGGTTTLVFDTERERLVDSWVSLSGTLTNCAGGVTPWGTWLSCEEGVLSPALSHLPKPARQMWWDTDEAEKEHGFVFEVPAEGIAKPVPLKGMGQFYHEAAAIDPQSGIVYMTEDISPRCGFYRFIPNKPGELAASGRLEMMRVEDGREMRDRVTLGKEYAVSWVGIEDPEKGNTDGNREGDGVFRQGFEEGGSAFISLEGCAFHAGRVYFTSKSGGRANAGYVFEYDPLREKLVMVFESPGHGVVSGPDNIIMSPRGSLVICEDRTNRIHAAQSIVGLTEQGQLFRFCRLNPDLKGEYLGWDVRDTARMSEWCGVTFSIDGDWLFCNLQKPGLTIAITGPWQKGLI